MVTKFKKSAERDEYVVPDLYESQLKFCQSKTMYTLYGGARGGGKSFVVRQKAIQLAYKYPGIQILIMRRTFKELETNHVLPFRSLLNGLAKYNTASKKFFFPNDSVIHFGYLNTDADVEDYQGHQYEAIFLDEATHFTFYMYMKMTECLRLSGSVDTSLGLKPRMYLTANPGGVGHTWVKRLFIDKKYENKEKPEDYSFIPALVFDNKYIVENDLAYIERLEALPEKERQAMLMGDWNVFEGQFFDEFDEEIHTYDPFSVRFPENVRYYRTRDYGLDRTACYWIARTEDGTSYVFKEFCKSNLMVSESGHQINALTPKDMVIWLDICPPDMWNRQSQTGKSAVDILIQECRQVPTKANNDRVTGWLMVKEMLKINPKTGKPFLQISQECPELIHCIKMIQHDEKNPNDCAKDPHDITHAVDALRYYCTSFSYSPEAIAMAGKQKEFVFAEYALEIGEYEKEETYYEDDYFEGDWWI